MIIEFEAVGSRAMRWSAEGEHTVTLNEGVATIADAEGKPVAKLSLLADDGTFAEPAGNGDDKPTEAETIGEPEDEEPAQEKHTSPTKPAAKKPAKRGR